jgi:beta-lactam-binding protein with PASTA domain
VVLTVAAAIEQVEVPDLIGDDVTTAQSELEAVGLVLGDQSTAPSDEFDEGQIISQTVTAGTPVDVGTVVGVTVSTGPSAVTIGDYTCRTFPSVKAELSKVGINVVTGGTAPVLSQCPNTNFIAMQDPDPGSSVPVGGTVTVYLGEEPSPSPSPTESPSP